MKVTDSKGKAHLECLNLICFGNLRQNRWVKVNTLGNNKPEKTLLRVFNSCVFNWGSTIGSKQGKMNQLRQQAAIMLMKKYTREYRIAISKIRQKINELGRHSAQLFLSCKN